MGSRGRREEACDVSEGWGGVKARDEVLSITIREGQSPWIESSGIQWHCCGNE